MGPPAVKRRNKIRPQNKVISLLAQNAAVRLIYLLSYMLMKQMEIFGA